MIKTKAQLEAELMDAKSDAIAWHQYAKRLEDRIAGAIDVINKFMAGPVSCE